LSGGRHEPGRRAEGGAVTSVTGPGEPDTATGADEERLDGRILRSSGWVAMSLGGKQLASLLSLLVLARLLEPRMFGLVSLSWAVLAFAEQIQESGIGAALIFRRAEVREAAATAAIWAPLASLVLYAATFALASPIAGLLHAPGLTNVLRLLAVVLVLRGLMVVPAAILMRELDFRAGAAADVVAALAQVGVAVGLAFAGAGVWSLVAGALAASAVQAAILWALVPWRPRLRLASFSLLREMMRYGRFVGVGNILNVVGNTIDNLAVARLLGTGPLGFYSVAYRVASFPNSVLGYVVSRVMFPIYAQLQDDPRALRQAYVRNMQRIAFVSLPAAVGIIVAARPIVLALLGPRWLDAVTPLRILGVYGLIKSLAAPSGEVFKGVGKPHIAPALSVPHLLLAVPVLYVLTRAYGLDGAALGILILIAIVGIPAMLIAMFLVAVPPAQLARALSTPALCALVPGCAIAVLLAPADALPPAAALASLAAAGLVAFVAAAALFGRGLLVPMWANLRASRR
jgi:O-antigen/teichoic acid export membrane protein